MAETHSLTFMHRGFRGRIGAARADITPPIGIYARNWGAATHDTAEGVHQPLTATALTLQQSGEEAPLVLISLDLGWWRSRKDEWYLRGYLLEQLNLTPERLMLSFTHTHSGPALSREDADKPGGDLIAPYLESLRESCVQLVRQALENAVPAILECSYGKCTLAQNRDMADPGSMRFLCGYRAYADADDTLLVGRVTAEDGRCLATLVNYACHPTTLACEHRLLSPDFVGAMRELVENDTDNAPCLFLQGASGELAPRQNYADDTAVADKNGRQLGLAVLSTLTGMLPAGSRFQYTGVVESGAPLSIWKCKEAEYSNSLSAVQSEVEYGLQKLPSLEEIDRDIEKCEDRAIRERLQRKRRIREGIGDGDIASMPLWVWRVGSVVLLAHPNEAYSLLQTTLRRQFPDLALVVMNVVNGHFGYLPPAELYMETIYPVWQTPFKRGSLEHFIGVCEQVISST